MYDVGSEEIVACQQTGDGTDDQAENEHAIPELIG
jgi:hypothetical protein